MLSRTDKGTIIITDTNGIQTEIDLRSVVDWIDEGIFCVNAEGIIQYANEQFCRNLGYQPHEIINTSIFDYFYSAEDAKAAKQKLELRKKGLSDTYETKMKRKNGQLIWLRVTGKPFFNSQGKFIASITLHIDITRQKLLEEELIYAKEDLESKIITRTRELFETNQKLSQQIKERKLAEVSFRNSEKKFRDIFLSSPDAIYVESYEGIVLDVNDATCKLHGMDKEVLIGKSIYELTMPEYHDVIRERQPKILSGAIQKFETDIIHKDQHSIPVEVSVSKIDYNNKPALLVHVRDITHRREQEQILEDKVRERTLQLQEMNLKLQSEIQEKQKMQDNLQRQKDFLRLIIDSIPNLLFVKDQNGKFLLANESVATFYNMTADRMEGFYDDEKKFTKEELELFNEQDKITLANNAAVQFPERKFIHAASGNEVWLSMVKKPIPSLEGQGTNILGIATDVTELKHAIKKSDTSEQLYRAIARNIPKAAMFIFDREYRYILAEGPLVGIISKPKQEIEGKTIYDVFKPEDIPQIEKIYNSILQGKSQESEKRLYDHWQKVYDLPIKNDEGEIIYGMVMVVDISDLKQAQLEIEIQNRNLQRSNEELERFAYVASHDLQGPLRSIASYLQLLEIRYKDKLDKEATEFIDYSVSGAKRMQSLIQDLLSYSRLTSKPRSPKEVDIEQIIEVVKSNLQAGIQQTGARITYDKLPVVMAESSQMLQLFQNLIDNAIKFTPAGRQPEIHISYKTLESFWEFTVSDNGIGMKDEFKERVFQIFQRLHTDKEYPGTGIGLAICKKIVQLHGGRIWFESSPGEGTQFHFAIHK